jgi:hypothetical protein
VNTRDREAARLEMQRYVSRLLVNIRGGARPYNVCREICTLVEHATRLYPRHMPTVLADQMLEESLRIQGSCDVCFSPLEDSEAGLCLECTDPSKTVARFMV